MMFQDWLASTRTLQIKSFGEREFISRNKFVEELVDVLHFVANQLVAAGCGDDELSERYAEKQQINRDRMASGTYDQVKTTVKDEA
jgi:hypothetical protein